MALFPLFYAGNLSYYRLLIRHGKITIEVCEHFPKQTYRNRIEILGPNGIHRLSIPVQKTGQRTPLKNCRISYKENWQKDHWKSLEAAYRRSPYFEYYEDRFKSFYTEPVPRLVDFNLGLFDVINDALGLAISYQLSDRFIEPGTTESVDYRNHDFSSDNVTSPGDSYIQVFGDRHPFTPNLSVLDALFNLGPTAKSIII